jgi:hypothetical protein
MSKILTPSQLVEERVGLLEGNSLPTKVMKENLVAFLHEFSYFTVAEKQAVFEHLELVSPNARRALVRVFSI